MNKKLWITLFFVICTIPLFAQTITIDKAKLEQLIQTAAQQYVTQAVEKAVAIAVKEEDNKYTLIIADKDKAAVELNGELAKKDVQIQSMSIQLKNSAIDLQNYKASHGIKHDLLVGGLSLLGGIIIGEVAH